MHRTQPAFFRGYVSFGGSRISIFVLPLFQRCRSNDCEAFKPFQEAENPGLFVIERSLSVSLPSTIPSELRHKHTTRVFTVTYRVCLRYFCRSKRYSQQNSMQKPDDPSSKFQVVSPTHRLRTTHFSGKIIKIIIAPKGHLRRS